MLRYGMFSSVDGRRRLSGRFCSGTGLIYGLFIDWVLGGNAIVVGLILGMVEAVLGFS